MRALVTGAAGFVGSHLCDALLAAGHEVRGVDCFLAYYERDIKERNLEAARGHGAFELHEADLVSHDLAPLLDGVDWVFHQAAQAGVRASWGEDFRIYSDNNVYATQRLLEACKNAAGLRRFVYASSSSVYGDSEDLPVTESSPKRPVSPYGVTKLAAEHLAWLYWKNHGVPTVSLRYFTVYGPRQRPDMAFHRFISAAFDGATVLLYGDGKQSRDFTYVSDIVRVNMAAATADVPGGTFNLGGGSRTTVNDVLDTIGRLAGRPVRIERREVQKGDVRHTAADTSAARAALGFDPQVDLEEGLVRHIDSLRSPV